ncbi:MAG: helix-turn-helix domain-containing protein [Chloroflexia bacterium]|nr:helix-turn-helix domain-containing protein [Chloroflexia bacterium]
MTDPATASFGPLLRRHRRAAGLSQAELAERAGLSAAAVRALESGRRAAPRPFTMRALADALALPCPALPETDCTALFEAVGPAAAVGTGSAPLAPTVDDRDVWSPLPAPPLPPTRLVGREREVAGVVFVLRSGRTRLVTLTGPGGVGKTRLATAVAREVGADYDDGVAWIDLAPMTAPPPTPRVLSPGRSPGRWGCGRRGSGRGPRRRPWLSASAPRCSFSTTSNTSWPPLPWSPTC